MIDPAEYIYIDTWAKLVNEFDEKFQYCPLDQIEVFGWRPDTILVSGCCDFGVHVQAEDHPNTDIIKHIHATNWLDLSKKRDRYVSSTIKVYQAEYCNNTHKYSIKTERFTWRTFPEIPNITKWFTTNSNIFHPAVSLLPFGLNSDEPLIRPRVEQNKLLYINFQLNSFVRSTIHSYWKSRHRDWFTFRPRPNIPYMTYLEELASHRFCLCPPGNGLDSYRIWECLYCGVVPILLQSKFSQQLVNYGLPVVVVPDMTDIYEEDLQALQVDPAGFDNPILTVSYWKKHFQQFA